MPFELALERDGVRLAGLDYGGDGMAGGDMVVSDSDGQAATVNVVTSAAPAAPLAGAGYVVSVPTSHALDSKPPCQPLVASPAPQVTCPYDQVTAVTIVLGDGNDTLTVKAPAGAPAFADLTLSLGDGTDTATVSVGATTGVSLQGNAGDDSMQATSGRGQVQIEGDAGNDTMDAGSAGGGSLLIAGDGDDRLISGRHSGAATVARRWTRSALPPAGAPCSPGRDRPRA